MSAIWAPPPGSWVVFAGAIGLGLLHGAEPGHGWPIAATYALDRPHKWRHGLLASTLLGLGHLVSSLAVVGAFFLGKQALNLERLNTPLEVGGVALGGPVEVVAGILLIGLGVREYRRGGHPHGQWHDHDDRIAVDPTGWFGRLRARLLGRGHVGSVDLDRMGLASLVWTAFVLGFVHEEEFEIIGLCLGSAFCLELMLAYAVAVVVALVGLTLLLVAGYYRYEDRMAGLAVHFPTISAVVLVTMGLGFVLGLF